MSQLLYQGVAGVADESAQLDVPSYPGPIRRGEGGALGL